MNNTKRSKNGMLLLIGAIAGAATTYYLSTPSGKKLVKKISDSTSEITSQIATRVDTIANEVQDQAKVALDATAKTVADLSDSAIKQYENIKDTVETKVDEAQNISNGGGFEAGLEKAKRLLKKAQ